MTKRSEQKIGLGRRPALATACFACLGLAGSAGSLSPPRCSRFRSIQAIQRSAPTRSQRTRSTDTRAPSSNELFATNSFSVENGGLDLTRSSPWRFSYTGPTSTAQENQDALIILEAGNSNLQPERSITETLGMVFQPAETDPGLQVSADYYRTTIEAGIRELNATETISACATEIGDRWESLPFVDPSNWTYCNNIEFGPADPTMEFFGPDSRTSNFGSDILGPDCETQVAPGTPNPYYYVQLPNGGNLRRPRPTPGRGLIFECQAVAALSRCGSG